MVRVFDGDFNDVSNDVSCRLFSLVSLESQKLVSIIPVLTCGACQIEGTDYSHCWISPTYRPVLKRQNRIRLA